MLEVGHWYNDGEILDFFVNGKEVEGCCPIMQQGTIQLKRHPREETPAESELGSDGSSPALTSDVYMEA